MPNKFYSKKRGRPKKKESTDSTIKQEIQDVIISHFEDDLVVATQNMEVVNKAFDDHYDMIHCKRKTKPNDWESDIYLPEFVSRILTQVGNFAARYFSSRDYVEVDEDTEDAKVIQQAKASKDLLNILLNDPSAYFFQKMLRLLMFVWPSGWSVIKGGYQQNTEEYLLTEQVSTTPMQDEAGNFLDEAGEIIRDTYMQRPALTESRVPVYDTKVIEDRPIFDVYPNQNVYFSPEYTYSLQQKEYVIFENDSMTLDELKKLKSQNKYFNLHFLEDSETPDSTNESGKKTWNKDGEFQDTEHPVTKKFRVLEWWRKYPLVVGSRDNKGRVIDWEIGVDSEGEIKEEAELVECIITTIAPAGSSSDGYPSTLNRLIGLRPSPHTKRPMVRFLCYIDALRDTGFGDGEMNWELQTAINDNFNLGNFRTKLATTPAFKGKRFSGIPEKVRVSPEEVIMTENLDDLAELQINDNINGTIIENQMLSTRMDYAMATAPQTMGHSPERAETATQASIVSQRAEIRISLKSTILEFVGLTEFYDMILTLCNDFMLPQTLERLIGDEAYNYNPNRLNKFKPVSQALETEESKAFKMRMIDQIMGRVVNFPNPKTPMVLNYLLGMWLEAAGKNFKHFKEFMFSEDPEINLLYQLVTGGQAPGLQQPALPGGGQQNQMGMPQSVQEQNARNLIGG